MLAIFRQVLCIAALAFFAAPSFAQDSSNFLYDLQRLNQTDITASPRYKNDQKMFAMRVLDNGQQLVGRVADIKMDEAGEVAQLVSEINRVGRYDNTVRNEAYEITFREDISAFEIPLTIDNTRDGPQSVSPEALAAITPAAGGGELYSLKNMIGAEVKSDDGRWLGEVKNVMFDEYGKKIEALMLNDVPGARRYTNFALPYNPSLITMRSDYGRIEFRVDRAAAQTVMDYAKNHR